VNHRNRAVVAVDVGGTAIKASVCDADLRELLRDVRPTPVSDGVSAVVEAIATVIADARRRLSGQCDILAVGVICPGVVDADAGIARYSANIGWRDLPLREQLELTTGLPVAIDHDVRAAGRAEFVLGAARGASHSLYVPIGTGIAGAIISNGRMVVGQSGTAGEIGHLPVFPDGEACACGQRGCTETYASAAALARRYGEQSGGRQLEAAAVIAAAMTGADPIATRVFDQASTALARALVSYTMLMDPALIVIGGGMSGAGQLLLDPLVAKLRKGLAWRDAPALVIGQFGPDAGRVGAALIAWNSIGAPT
jgi:glucokinase